VVEQVVQHHSSWACQTAVVAAAQMAAYLTAAEEAYHQHCYSFGNYWTLAPEAYQAWNY